MTKLLARDTPARFYGRVLKGALASSLLAMSIAGAAQAAVITFEGQSGSAMNDQAFTQNGYQVRFFAANPNAAAETVTVGQFIDGGSPSANCGGSSCPTNDQTTFLALNNSGYVDIVPASGQGTFSFTSLDASFLGASVVRSPGFAGAIQVRGYSSPNQAPVVDQFNLPAPDDNGNVALQTFDAMNLAGKQFAELVIVGFTCDTAGHCTGLDNSSGQYALDNIVLSDQAPGNNVPEPATAALLGAGVLGFGVRRRKRA